VRRHETVYDVQSLPRNHPGQGGKDPVGRIPSGCRRKARFRGLWRGRVFHHLHGQAQTDRNKALVDLQTAVEAHAKLQGEFDVYKKFVMDRDKEAKEKLAVKKPAAVEVKARA
jgi:hypothetical protein